MKTEVIKPWVDRLLPFNLNKERIPAKQMGFADYFSRNPYGTATPPSEEDTHFVINKINDSKSSYYKPHYALIGYITQISGTTG